MKKTILLSICISYFLLMNPVNLLSQTPNWEWARSYGLLKHDYGSSIATDPAGNVYVTGYFADTAITIGSFTLINADPTGISRDMFIVKYDNLGNVIWAKSTGGIKDDFPSAITVDASGNCYVTGSFYSTSISFGSFTLTRAGTGSTCDFFLVKYNSAGNELMAIREGGIDNEWTTSIAVDVSGNIYVSGKFFGSTFTIGSTTLNQLGNGDLFIAKYNAAGNPQWAKSAGGNLSEDITAIRLDHSGNIYVVGNYQSPTITFGLITLTITSTSYRDLFIVKYDQSGTVLWVKTATGTAWDYAADVSVDAANNVYVLGGSQSQSITFDATTLYYYSGINQLFLVKYNAAGTLLWAENASTPTSGFVYARSIETDSVGNSYITGDYSDTVTFGSVTISTNGPDEVFVAKYNASGAVYWIANSTGTTGSGVNSTYDITIDNSGNSYITGFFYSAGITFGTSQLTNADTAMMSTDIFVAKLDNSGTIITGIKEEPTSDALITVYPNPFNSVFTIAAQETNNAQLEICNLLGEIVYQSKIESKKTEIDLSAISSGVYFVLVKSDKVILTQKIIKQ